MKRPAAAGLFILNLETMTGKNSGDYKDLRREDNSLPKENHD